MKYFMNFSTDEEIGGNTSAEITFEEGSKVVKISGLFKMYKKELIDNQIMYCVLSINMKSLFKYDRSKANIIRINMRTNNNIIKVKIGQKYITTETFIAHILCNSNQFETFELPLMNFKNVADTFDHRLIHEKLDSFYPGNLEIIVESAEEKHFEVEIRSIEFEKNDHLLEKYESYNMPFFKVL
eukprot:CAMPEP_0170522150 /NCGR_PEP_ID=MMETSP0209-20121228/7604_1 /TAXON_ID=665100 ORGANISM="Litonotus pictus, Strain P1" /NCGR_SAMPLE_ID=MMETSP0209 /ASSEMBLY_ACC=CAM_ASM_000301 /LENGTH=183 /DNA_ID=CAMNT_0010809509 /DNA_START=227 /DNA_END=775 /DNA_ORIENTATION=-